MATLPRLKTLLHNLIPHEVLVPLSPPLRRLYGELSFPAHPERPYVISNFVSTLDGVVSLNMPGMTSGSEISGNNAHDKAIMGLLRGACDAVIVGARTIEAIPRHLLTPEDIYQPLATEFARLRATIGKPAWPLHVIVTGSGAINLDMRVFQSGEVPVLVVTTEKGGKLLRERGLPSACQMAIARSAGMLSAKSIIDAVNEARPNGLLLVEGGPSLMSAFFGERQLNELFLTVAPQIAGRDESIERPGLVMGKLLAPGNPTWGELQSAKLGGSHLFLRYVFPAGA